MIYRIWHGYTTPEKAPANEAPLRRLDARSQHYEQRASRSY